MFKNFSGLFKLWENLLKDNPNGHCDTEDAGKDCNFKIVGPVKDGIVHIKCNCNYTMSYALNKNKTTD